MRQHVIFSGTDYENVQISNNEASIPNVFKRKL